MVMWPGKAIFLAVSGFFLCGTCLALVDVALVEFVLWGDKTTTSMGEVGALLDIGEQEMRVRYGMNLNLSRVRIYDRSVTTCEIMDRKGTFWATRYYYREMQGSPVMGMFGPGCPTAAASVGHLAPEWNKVMMIPHKKTVLICGAPRFLAEPATLIISVLLLGMNSFHFLKTTERRQLSVASFLSVGIIIGAGHLIQHEILNTKVQMRSDPGMVNKKRYPTLTRVSPYMEEDLHSFVFKLLTNFTWNTVGILCDDALDMLQIYVPMCTSLFDSLRLTYNISASRFYVNASDPSSVKHYLEEIKSLARVVVIVAHGSRIRPIMLSAYDQGMTNGEYAYLAVELYPSLTFFGNNSWATPDAITDGRNEDAKTAYQSLFVISLHYNITDDYRMFTDKIKARSSDYGYIYRPGEEVNPFAISYFYALRIYGEVLNEMVAMGENPQDGVAMTKRMWNKTFDIMGQQIVINAYGDREADWSLNQMNSDFKFRPVLQWFAHEKRLHRVSRSDGTDLREIVWYNSPDKQPPNEPRCGYRGTKQECEIERRRTLAIALCSVIGIVLICAVATLVIYRKKIKHCLSSSQDEFLLKPVSQHQFTVGDLTE